MVWAGERVEVPLSGRGRRQLGFSLVQLLVSLAVVGMIWVVGAPSLFRTTSRARVRLAAAELATTLRLSRIYALRHSANVGAKFRTLQDGVVTFTLYRDGDGDGVRTRDIDSGVDPPAQPPRRLTALGRGVGFGFPPGGPLPHPTSGRLLDRLDDPIRFNRSDIASFSSEGGATPGTLYLTDGRRELFAVRVSNRTGRVRVMRFDHDSEKWRSN